MGAAGTYRVGRSDLFLPGDLQADAVSLNQQVHALYDALQSNTGAPTDWFDSWNAWFAQWWAFYKSTFEGGYLTALAAAVNDGNRDALVSYETRFAAWAKDAANFGTALPDGAGLAPSTGSGDAFSNQLKALGLPSLETIGLVLGIAVSAYVIYKASK